MSESPGHWMTKERICQQLSRAGKQFVTEAIFTSGGRADILVLDDFKVIEIVKTETEKSIMKKRETYPKGLDLEVIKVGDIPI